MDCQVILPCKTTYLQDLGIRTGTSWGWGGTVQPTTQIYAKLFLETDVSRI